MDTNESAQPETTEQVIKSKPKRENMLYNLLFNIIIPAVILSKFSGENWFGPAWGIVVALSFPIGYGIKDYSRANKVNFFSALGIFSVLMTGGLSLLELDPKYIAYKEAGIPLAIGIAVIGSLKTPWPLVRMFLYSDLVLDIKRIEHALDELDNKVLFDKALIKASWMLAGSFFVSSILNYVLARVVLVASPGTEEFNAQLGKMTVLSYPVIFVPAMIILLATFFYLFRQITKLTHLDLEEIIVHPDK